MAEPAAHARGQQRQRERADYNRRFGSYDNPENRSLTERCLMFGSNVGPPMIPNSAYNNNYTIFQRADYVIIHAEVVHDTRIIRPGPPDPLPDHIRPWMGDSWGRCHGPLSFRDHGSPILSTGSSVTMTTRCSFRYLCASRCMDSLETASKRVVSVRKRGS